MIAYLAEELEDERALRYIVATTSERTVHALKQGALTVREALLRGSLWLVDTDQSYAPQRAFFIELDDIPDDVLPAPGIMLWAHLQPALTVRLVGDSIVEGRVPASALLHAAEWGATGLKPIIEWAARDVRADVAGRPPEWLQALYSKPTQYVAFGSLEVAFSSQPVQPANQVELALQPEIGAIQKEIKAKATHAFREGLDWATQTAEDRPLGDDDAKSMAVLETLKRLAPGQDGVLSEVHLSGPIVSGSLRPVTLNRAAGKRVRSELTRLKKRHEVQLKVFKGRIRDLDLDKLTIVLRNQEDGQPDMFLELENNQLLEVAREAHYQELFVSVAARSQDKRSWIATEIEFTTTEPVQPGHDVE
ncbi:MAG: hypothetical protein KGO50_08740 [Myxococcales bacterium]|nr:hypothetical protein [Myxococcales bacterium]